ncbi:MAG TPA: molybdopterin-dependent oxidoreductase, partial [Thermoanaerobaculia bacterium]|nr:molybdopterin-dependent oxidoreductase [Thermoanaerobaculia bacterium]
MILDRRELLKLLGLAGSGTAVGGCDALWKIPDELVERALRGPGLESFAHTVCGLCEGGCGLTVRLVDDLPVGLKGNPRHPLNRGGLCPVGQGGLEVLYAPERLTGPTRRAGEGERRPVAWEEALDEIGGRLAALRAQGAGSRFALLSGVAVQLFDDLARRFAHSLGSPNVERFPQAPDLVYRLSQGLDQPPGFDLAHADLVLSFGLDLFEDGPAPLHAVSALVGDRRNGERAGLIHVGTRLSPSAAKAGMRIPVEPGTHGAFALGVAHVLVREGHYDRRFVAEHTFGFDDWVDEGGRQRLGFRRLLLERYYPDRAARLSGCDAERIVAVARRAARAEAPLALAGGEAVAGANGTWTAFAVHALNALLGSFDRPGGVLLPAPISFTPLEPLDDAPPAEASVFAPPASGAFGNDPVAALADGVLQGTSPLEVLFVVGADPLHDSPVGERLREAFERIPMVVAFTPFETATAAAADFVLPTHVPLEAWSDATTPPTVAFSTLGLGHPIVEPLHDTRHPGDVLLGLARRADLPLGAGPPWETYEAYLRHRLAGVAAAGQGSVVAGGFEESWTHFLEARGWRFLQHTDAADLWRAVVKEGGWWNPVHARGDWQRLLPTSSGRFEFFSRTLERRLVELGRQGGDAEASEAMAAGIASLGLAAQDDEACLPHYEPPGDRAPGELALVPFRPLTARGPYANASPTALEMFGYPVLTSWQTWAEIAPATALELDLHDGDRVAVESKRGAIEAVVRVQRGATPGVVHVPVGLGPRTPGAP